MKYYTDDYTSPDLKTSEIPEDFHIALAGAPEPNPEFKESMRKKAVAQGKDLNDVYTSPVRYPTAWVSGRMEPAVPFIPNYADQTKSDYPTFSIEGQTGLSTDYIHKMMGHINAIPPHQRTQEDVDAQKIGYRLLGKSIVEPHEFENNKHFQPETLFDTKPRTAHVDSLFSDPSLERSAMPLLGIALEHTGAQVIEPSDNLSVHSSRLVKKAIERGFPIVANPLNPSGEVTNTINKQPRHYYGDPANFQLSELPEETVTVGKARFFDTLRNSPKRNTQPVTQKGLSDQFLPGMEKFA